MSYSTSTLENKRLYIFPSGELNVRIATAYLPIKLTLRFRSFFVVLATDKLLGNPDAHSSG